MRSAFTLTLTVPDTRLNLSSTARLFNKRARTSTGSFADPGETGSTTIVWFSETNPGTGCFTVLTTQALRR